MTKRVSSSTPPTRTFHQNSDVKPLLTFVGSIAPMQNEIEAEDVTGSVGGGKSRNDSTHGESVRNMEPDSGKLLRRVTEQSVLEAVFREGPITRPEIAQLTGLTKPTVSQAVASLKREGMVRDCGRRRGKLGPVANLYSVVSDKSHVLAVEISYHVTVLLANIYGEVLTEAEKLTDTRGGDHVLQQVLEVAYGVLAAAEIGVENVTALAIGVPGAVDSASGVISFSSSVPGLEDIGIAARLSEQLGVQVVLENSINLGAVGEKWRGCGKDYSDFVFFSVGTHVGMGLVLGNELYRGARGAAGQAALLPLLERSEQVPGSGRRTPEAYEARTGRAGFVRSARDLMGGRPDSGLPRTAEEVFEMAQAADVAAIQAIEKEAHLLALSIVTAVSVLDPETIVMEGGVGSHPSMLPLLNKKVGELVPQPPPVKRTTLGGKASAYGALETALQVARKRFLATDSSGLQTPKVSEYSPD